MPFLSEQDTTQLRDIFTENLSGNVRLRLFTRQASKLIVPGREGSQECATCSETQELLQEVVGLSDRLEVVVHDVKTEPEMAERYGVDGSVPAIVLEPSQEPENPIGRMRFLGIPAGYEFSTLVSDLVDVSNGHVDLSPEVQEELRGLDQDLHIQVFVTPT